MDDSAPPEETAREFDAASDAFDAVPFWERFGRLTAERAGLRPGWRVVDVCCGTGAAAIPAAAAVGPQGDVLGLDISGGMLARARAKAAARGLRNTEFRIGDLRATGLPAGCADAVLCCFGIFFVADQRAAAAELWRLLRPGGRLVVTTWGEELLEPALGRFMELLAAHGVAPPDGGSRPYAALTSTDGLERLLRSAGARDVACEYHTGTLTLGPGDWWRIAVGSGLRGFVDRLTPEVGAEVRRTVDAVLAADGIREVRLDVVTGVAQA